MPRERAQDYDQKRLAILDKSAALFAHYGFHGTSMTMIADACRVSKALFYHYYPDKEEVLFDILQRHLHELVMVTQKALLTAQKPRDRLFLISAALLQAYKNADAKHQVQIANLRLLPPKRQEVLRSMERTLVEIFSGAITDAVPKLANNPMLKAITMSLFGMLNWHYLWFKEGKGLTREQFAKLATELVAMGSESASKAVASANPSFRPLASGGKTTPRRDHHASQKSDRKFSKTRISQAV